MHIYSLSLYIYISIYVYNVLCNSIASWSSSSDEKSILSWAPGSRRDVWPTITHWRTAPAYTPSDAVWELVKVLQHASINN